MKTVFIINPCAGQGNKIDSLINKINATLKSDKEIYITRFSGDAMRFVREYCKTQGAARFIACGGDGTFNEVLNGAMECDKAEVGIIPVGTGNDFCRNFDSLFDEISSQITSGTVRCDAIKYTTETDAGVVTGYCANMFNIGFDCNVADMTAKMKTKPFLSGSLAYLISIFVTLITKRGADLKVEVDGEEKHCGKLLLTSVANGCYCGGGIKSNPLASICDGTININIIKDVKRLKFLYLLPFYMKGTYLKLKNIEKVIYTASCEKIVITPKVNKMRLCIDGEIINAGKTQFEICPGIFNFVVPDDCGNIKKRK
ncbi:MAG: YegS/Rv2252/BmrU family lipid kinase, partial [Clostridia bacterium]|nr:YegS/Rv2252/BmrU family lipid kinase [Clostridia bacterium]